MNITRHFFEAAGRHPARTAIIDADGHSVTFGELSNAVQRTAAYYRSKGIRKGDRVLVFVPMGIPLYRCILALFRIGAVAVFLDEWVSRERMETCCRLVRCQAFIAPFKLRMLALLSKELRKIPVWIGPDMGDLPQDDSMVDTSGEDTALITFTTGSTGIPKAADRTHAFLDAQFRALVDHIQPRETDIDMPVLPIVLLLNLGTGIPSVIADFNPRKPAAIKPERLWEQITQHQVNRFIASPFVAEQLALSAYRKKSPLRVFTGGAPVFPAQAKKLISGLPGSSIEIVYGSTEAEPISSISADELLSAIDSTEGGLSVGRPYAGIEVVILPVSDAPIVFSGPEEMHAQTLRQGEIGEIVVKGSHVLQHYIDNPEAERMNKIRIGDSIWHRTGDAGFLSADGTLFLCGRCNTLIRINGKIIAPFMWEAWLCSLPGIRMGTVIEDAGQLMIVLEVDADMDKETLAPVIHARLPQATIRYISKMPRDQRHFTKIDYGKLKSMIGATVR